MVVVAMSIFWIDAVLGWHVTCLISRTSKFSLPLFCINFGGIASSDCMSVNWHCVTQSCVICIAILNIGRRSLW